MDSIDFIINLGYYSNSLKNLDHLYSKNKCYNKLSDLMI